MQSDDYLHCRIADHNRFVSLERRCRVAGCPEVRLTAAFRRHLKRPDLSMSRCQGW